MKKPSGNANIPGHVRLAKDVKKLIDEASSVFLASDNEDEIGEGDGGAVDRCEDGNHTSQLRGESDESDIENEDFNLVDLPVNEYVGSADSLLVEEAGDAAETEKTPSKLDRLTATNQVVRADLTGLELELAEAASAVAATPSFSASTGVAESGEVTLRRSRRNKASLVASVPTPKRSFKSRKPAKTSESARPQARMSAEVREKLQYPDLAESSDRLGGVNLAAMRNASNSRTYEEFEEASYSKQKRIKAEKAASDLKRKLDRAAQSSADSGNELVKTIMVLRADADREDRARMEAAESKRAAERDAREERRREERREEREAAEERRREERREEREAAEERRRVDREESRAHMREMLMMLSAIQNGKIPAVDI
ncbi:hypothetical protein PPTG_08531 [Phytophthora nicotianae INRA-310]|uniref:Uncharacterized protein n=1 Tax=Phytophthora nicotianae (strain INRA-310) TaxID=761204 RepID=W2QNM2_PHYN3|nr:hypothetical protein PPTG_08531 [Phytophthora nicotianae INRA-310]ETN13830.1 hypothetical protein PPTG_08531 [Phytophthora nicotianae INRA-310]